MPRQPSLASVPTEALVAELRKRFAELEKAKAALLDLNVSTSTPVQSKHTSAYARQVSALTQKIRHAKHRKDDPKVITDLMNEREKLRAQHKKA